MQETNIAHLSEEQRRRPTQITSPRQLEAIPQQFAEVFEGGTSRNELRANKQQDWTSDDYQ
jgi:hypothetical protein